MRDEIDGYNAYYRRVKDEWTDWRRGYIKINSKDHITKKPSISFCTRGCLHNHEKYRYTEVELTDDLNELSPRRWKKNSKSLKKEAVYYRNRAYVPFDYISTLLAPVDDLNKLFLASLPPPEKRCPIDHSYQNDQCIAIQRCDKDSECSDKNKSCDFGGLPSSTVGFCAENTTPDQRLVVQKDKTVRYNKRVSLTISNTPGLTKSCGMYGCRVLQSSDREVKLAHGGRRDTKSKKPGSSRAFYVRGHLKDKAKNDGKCVKYGDEIFFTRTPETYKTGNCGIYGCRVMFANGKEGSLAEGDIRLHHGKYAKPFKIGHVSRPSTYVGKCVKLGDPVYLMAKTPDNKYDFFYKSGDRGLAHGTSKTKFYLFNGF